MTLHVDLGLLKQIHIYFVSPKRKIWFWRPKSISPYENFLNWSTEREKKKKPRSRVSAGATLDLKKKILYIIIKNFLFVYPCPPKLVEVYEI